MRSVEVAMVNKVRLHVRSSFDDPARPRPGTLICEEDEIMEQEVVTGIAFSRDEAQITLREVADKPGVAAAIFMPLAEANINVDMIIQVVSDDTTTTDITFTVPAAEYGRAMAILEQRRAKIGYAKLNGAEDVVKISAIGVGMLRFAPFGKSPLRAFPGAWRRRRASTSAPSRLPRSSSRC